MQIQISATLAHPFDEEAGEIEITFTAHIGAPQRDCGFMSAHVDDWDIEIEESEDQDITEKDLIAGTPAHVIDALCERALAEAF